MRIGVDLGGTKIEAIALDATGAPRARRRVATPRGDYRGTIAAIVDLVAGIERDLAARGSIGVAIPGTESRATGRIKNANSTWLIGRPFARDLGAALERTVRLANDANCFALSEARDGAAAGAYYHYIMKLFAVSIDNRGCGDMIEKKYTSVLGWDSPFDIACKLEHEIERMQRAETLRDFIEHTMNFALTAYHMIDWVWAALQRNPVDGKAKFERDKWIAVIGYKPKKCAEVWSWAMSRCPELEYCRQLANATKHLSCRSKKDAPNTEFGITPTAEWGRQQKKAPFMSIVDDHRAENWRLVFVENGKYIDLAEVLQDRVFVFWKELTHRIYIG